MNRFGLMAQRYWQAYRNQELSEVEDPEVFFARMGEEIEDRIDALAGQLAARWAAQGSTGSPTPTAMTPTAAAAPSTGVTAGSSGAAGEEGGAPSYLEGLSRLNQVRAAASEIVLAQEFPTPAFETDEEQIEVFYEDEIDGA